MGVDKFGQWPAKAVVLSKYYWGHCDLSERQNGKKIVRHPTAAVRRSSSSAPVSLQQGATASPALWLCGEGAGGSPAFRHQLCPVCASNRAVQLWQRPVQGR